MMFSSTKINTYALKKDNFISISLETVNIATKPQKKETIVPQKELQSVPEVKEVDIGNLFSDVWTKDVKIKKQKKKVTNNKILDLFKKKIKTKDKNNNIPKSEKIMKSESDLISDKAKKSSSGDEVNEYLAKIQAIVYKYFYPPNNSQGHTVKAIIELSAIGKVLDFRVLTYSSNQALNEECDKIQARLLGVLFPSNPQSQSSSTIVNITSDKNKEKI